MKPLLPHEIIPNSQTMKSSSPVQMQGYPLSLQRSLLGMGTQGGFTSVDESSSSDGSGQMPAQTEAPNAGTISNPPSSSQQSLQQRRYSHPDNARPKESNHSNDPDDNVSSNYPFSSSQASSQNHGYYSQGQTPSRKYDEAEGILPAPPSAGKLPPPIRRTSKSHIRLQEALSSDAALPAPSRSVAGTTNIPPASHGPQFLNREPPSELSEYIHSDQPPPVRGSSLVPPSSSTAAPSVPNPRRTNPTGNYQPPTLQKKTSSFLRLSTNLEGKAEVVIDTEPTLPPPLPLSGMMTPRRPAAPVASSSSVLRAVDSIKSSKVWEFYCDQKQHQHPSSSGSRSSSCSSSCSCSACAHGYRDLQHHHHHQSFEPDEAGTALSIARSRKRRRS
ncbi:hypothetical protein BDZ91DRAFT_135716 [Kalaharituber pfeilii]|nr:hypothetical protein BDZ91DRAFT_135716 [Kalaharituber pfeilii]